MNTYEFILAALSGFGIAWLLIGFLLFFNQPFIGEPLKESILKKYNGKKLTVLASYFLRVKKSQTEHSLIFEQKYITLFVLKKEKIDGVEFEELIYCYTSSQFNVGEEIEINYLDKIQTLNYYGSKLTTVHL